MRKNAMNTPRTLTRQNAGRFRSDTKRWLAVNQKDAAGDGRFVFAVKTTGVYCRPSCSARLPLRKNVAFYETIAAAEAAGFRACKRCHPDGLSLAERNAAAVATACRSIESSGDMPALATLAKAAEISPSHFHRLFKSTTGLTPKAYALAQRANRVRAELPKRDSVTEAIYGAGFNSNGRFYAESGKILGMKPAAFRQGGRGEAIRFAIGQCSLGAILVAASTQGICAISLDDSPEALVKEIQDRFPQATLVGADRTFERWVSQAIGLVDVPHVGVDLPLDLRGTAFQQRVWATLKKIAPGTPIGYAELARRVGAPRAVRAVASACAANLLALAIPCHRVVRTDGSISGYRWGIERKRRLLKREAEK